jgi:putative Mg2+ transporter-C (MgtC) family protein
MMQPLNIDLTEFRVLFEVAAAMLLGALIGLDREAAEKPAGIRTHMLVAGAAAFLVSLGQLSVEQFGNLLGAELIRADPIRVIEAVITGVSFLGAGTIIRRQSQEDVKGLTTAASILFAATVGIGVALSQWITVLGATGMVLITLRLLPPIERWLKKYWINK